MNCPQFSKHLPRLTATVALLIVTVSGCNEQKYQAITGAPDGNAEILSVGNDARNSIEHVEGSFLELVEQPNRVVLVDFWGPHCGPCLHLAPELEQIVQKYPDQVSVVKVDVESSANSELALFFGVHAIPEMRVFVDGQSMGAIHGYVNASAISQQLEPAIALLSNGSGS
jgi:thioredoxin 1